MVGAPFDSRVAGLNIAAGAFAVGVILGGLYGLAAVIFFIPRYDSLMGLLIVLGVGTAMATWLSTGAKRNSYAGWQMALALFMTIVQDPHPVTELDVIWDRFVGIVSVPGLDGALWRFKKIKAFQSPIRRRCSHCRKSRWQADRHSLRDRER
jgi:hypothetical protein